MARKRSILGAHRFRHSMAFGFGCAVLFLCVVLYHHAVLMIPDDYEQRPEGGRSAGELLKRRTTRRGSPIIATIKNREGEEIIDCFDIYRQPAFEHPLLRNHEIQMKPSSYPGAVNRGFSSEEDELPRKWDLKIRSCPGGTIPVRRTENAFREQSLSLPRRTYHPHHPIASQLNTSTAGENNPAGALLSHEHAVAYVRGNYSGAKAAINVWNPRVEGSNEFSLAQIWLLSEGHLNSIEAGWMVHPSLYGDNMTRFFVYWTADHYKRSGCYNHLCPGFVQTNPGITLGFAVSPLSTAGGKQYCITVEIFRDASSGNWWLFVQGEQMGYWPGELLPGLSGGAYMIEWGGEVVNAEARRHTATQMGSGRFPEEGFQSASYFRDVQVVEWGANAYAHPAGVAPLVQKPGCYSVWMGSGGGRGWGTHFYYGGPGWSQSCP